MTRYAHARPGERCTRCNDLAHRVVGTQPLCITHMDILVGAIHRKLRWKALTPPFPHLDDYVTLGIVTETEAIEARRKQVA